MTDEGREFVILGENVAAEKIDEVKEAEVT